MAIKIHTSKDFEKMREAGGLAARTLDFITEHVVPGVTTDRLNDLCHEFIISQGGIPAPLNYKGLYLGYWLFSELIWQGRSDAVCMDWSRDRWNLGTLLLGIAK